MYRTATKKIQMTKENLKTTLDNFIIDKPTNCYNQVFLYEFLLNELNLIDHSNEGIPNTLLVFIKIDNIININTKYQNEIGDETIANLSYLLKEVIDDNQVIFKISGPNFVMFCPNFDGDIHECVGKIQNTVKNAEIFIEPITISASIIFLSEIDKNLSNDAKINSLLKIGYERLNLSHQLGDSAYVDRNTVVERKFFGNILIADSDVLTLSIMKSYFEENHFSVITVSNGLSALEALKKQKYDAIVADRYLEKIDGLTLKKHINESTMNMNTMFLLTVQSKNTDIVNKANLIDISYIFDKPIILEEVLGIIRRETKKKTCISR